MSPVDGILACDFTAVADALQRFNQAMRGLLQPLAELQAAEDRREAQMQLQLGRVCQLGYPDDGYDVQLVTTNEGRCRVVVRRLGGWS